MTSPSLVTAIIIFLNEERFISEAIESVLAQSYPHWEMILIDDGSTDESTKIAQAYARREPGRIRYFDHADHANHGMSASRNLGLDHSRGRYIGFLDADDVWMPNKLQEQVDILEAHRDVAMVYGRTLLWHSWRGDADEKDEFCDLGVPPDSVITPPALLVNLIENRAQTPTTCNALMRHDAVKHVGGFESEFRGMFEDQVFFMKISMAFNIYVSSRQWACYRQREDSCSAQSEFSGQVQQARMRLFAWLANYLRIHRVDSPEVWRMLRRQRLACQWPILFRARSLWKTSLHRRVSARTISE